jgi:hypothetical protein
MVSVVARASATVRVVILENLGRLLLLVLLLVLRVLDHEWCYY